MPSEQPSDGISISASAAAPLFFPDCNPMDNVSPFAGKTAACSRWRANAVQPCRRYRHAGDTLCNLIV
ncbi:TPA: hypothetical protein ACFU14_000258 [Neisseria cinerea]